MLEHLRIYDNVLGTDTGSVERTRRERHRPVLNQENQLAVLTTIIENPQISSRQVSSQLNISQTSVRRVITKENHHPYHILNVQGLLPQDCQSRTDFFECFQSKLQLVPDFLNSLFWTDESTFHRNGFANRRNTHYYSTQNPIVARETKHQYRWVLNVWGGILGTHIIGPFFIDEHLDAERYLFFYKKIYPYY